MTEQAKKELNCENEWRRLWGMALDLKRRISRVEKELGITPGGKKRGQGGGGGETYKN